MIRRAITLLALVSALSLVVPMVAGAATSGTASQAISDCNAHDKLTAYYSPAALRAALAQMPSDVKEYTDCYDVIEQQLFKEIGQKTSGGGTASSSSSGSSVPTWLIIVIVVLALAAITFGAIAFRRRSGGPGGPGSGGPGEGGPPGDPGAGGPPAAPAT
jgi:ABC-type transport system involved in multi-copper enzyme maturation permease subunit